MNLSDLRQRFSSGNQGGASIDFGLGDKVARKQGTRLINNDGTFNVRRRGRAFFAPYQDLVEMSWSRFLAVTVAIYVVCNALFALTFYLIGPGGLTNVDPSITNFEWYLQCFYFSVQTFTTVGYGTLSPVGMLANTLAAMHALFGWIMLALATGLFYARFSRPRKMVLFSERAIVADYQDGIKSLQFRIANKRDTNLINVTARVVLTWLDKTEDGYHRSFSPLVLERDLVALFPLNWTIVHPIDEDSPMTGWTKKDYCKRQSELLIVVEGYDNVFSQQVSFRNSYVHDEIIWNARFQPMYQEVEDSTELFLDRIDLFEEE